MALRRRSNARLLRIAIERKLPREVDHVFRRGGVSHSRRTRGGRRTQRPSGCPEEQAAARQAVVRRFVRWVGHQCAVATFSAILDSGSCRAWMALLSLTPSDAFSSAV